ncbi:helix-turn-helix transcriptional regulator [Streptomyces sp. NPDC059718]
MSREPVPEWLLAQRRRVGDRVRELRNERELSQEQLAHLADVARHSVYRTELGTHAASIDLLGRIARALGVEVSSFFN